MLFIVEIKLYKNKFPGDISLHFLRLVHILEGDQIKRGFFIGKCSSHPQSVLVFQLNSSSSKVFMIGFGPSNSTSFLASLSNASSVSRVYLKLPSFSSNDTQYFFTSTSLVLWRRISKIISHFSMMISFLNLTQKYLRNTCLSSFCV